MEYDFNIFEQSATKLVATGRFHDAIKIYLFMADGDPSLDAGYLAERIGQCYEQLGDIHAASYWFGRAIEENPQVRLYSTEARNRLETQLATERNILISN